MRRRSEAKVSAGKKRQLFSQKPDRKEYGAKMDDYLALLDGMRQLLEEDESEINRCLGGDLLNGYIAYMEEEKLLLRKIMKECFSLI